jgi:hypothetical protein
MWVMLVFIFDGSTCVALRAELDPTPALTSEAATPVPCEQQMNHLDPNVMVALSKEERQTLQDQLCATPLAGQSAMELRAEPTDIPYARGRCPQLDSFVHRSMTIDELNDLEDQLCPIPTPTPTLCQTTVAAQLPASTDTDRKVVVDALCQEPLSEPQRTGN